MLVLRLSVPDRVMMRVILPLWGGKRRYGDAARIRRQIAAQARRPTRHTPPAGLRRRAVVTLRDHDGWPVYEVAPRSPAAPGRHVLFFHGGAYINEILRPHWWFIGDLVRASGARCVVPIYPLGAAAGAAATVATAADVAAQLVERVGGERVVLMGDSAGGGLAVAVAQALRDRGMSADRLVLLAPWLDVATDDPLQVAIAPRDPMLAIPGLREAARTYARDLPLDDPRVSPIYGDVAGLPPTTVFVGTEDLLNPDSRRLREACHRAGVACELVEAPGMPHDYPLLPMRDGRAARRRIAELVRG